MSPIDPDEINPFQAPRSEIGVPPVEADSDALAVRLAYIRHEASVKSIGLVCYLIAGLCLFAAGSIGLATRAARKAGESNMGSNPAMAGVLAGFSLALIVVYGGVGYGLRRLQAWARWTTIVLICLLFLYNAGQVVRVGIANPDAMARVLGRALGGSVIPGYILYLVASARGAMVFSPEYREVIRQTPQARYGTSLFVKILLGFFLAIIVLVIIAGIVGGVSGR